MTYAKVLSKLQTLLDFLSELASQCWPHYENSLQMVLVVYTNRNKEVSVSGIFFPHTMHMRSALQFAPAVGAATQQSPSCFDFKQQSPMNKIQTSVHVLYKTFTL